MKFASQIPDVRSTQIRGGAILVSVAARKTLRRMIGKWGSDGVTAQWSQVASLGI